MKGRKPKPTQLKIVQGTFRPDRAPQNEPKPRPIAPDCPLDLSDAARTIWLEIAPSLEKLGLLTEVDGPAFGMLCEAQARYRLAQERFRSILANVAKGNFGKNPAKHLKTVRMAEVSAAARSSALQTQFQNGVLTIDEWRAIENRNPLPNGLGQKHFVMQNTSA